MDRLPPKRYWSGKRGEGVGYKFICDHVNYQGDDCVFWPLSRGDGYGAVAYNGRLYRAHRFMCIQAHGEPPTPRHQAAHSCGNGRKGCVNPKHLSWKTNSQNQMDRRAHGTSNVWNGKTADPKVNKGKLTAADDEVIRELSKTMTQMQIAAMYGVTHSTIQYRLYGGSHKPRRDKLKSLHA